MKLIFVLVVVFVLLFVMNRIMQSVISKKRAAMHNYLALDSSCRKRTENLMSLMKIVKNDLKEKAPEYNVALQAMKNTLEAKPPPEQAKLEINLCEKIEALIEEIRKHEYLKTNPELQSYYKLLKAGDKEIALKAIDYNQKVDIYNQSLKSGLSSAIAKLLKYKPSAKFHYNEKA